MSYLPSNRPLLDRFRAGARGALTEVYRHYAAGVGRYLRHGFLLELEGGASSGAFSRPLELADAIQETFARAFAERARLGYDGINPYAAFLSGIARNVVLEHLRRRQTASALRVGLSNETAASPAEGGPDLAAEESEAGRLVSSFVDGLAEPDQALFRTRFSQNRSQEEAAGMLGVTRIKLRRAELRVRRQLLEYLRGSGYLEHLRIEGWALTRPPRADRGAK